MKKFNNFSLPSAFIGLLIATHCYATVLMPRQMIVALADTRMISEACPKLGGAQTACSVILGDWNAKDYTCSKTTISKDALKTVTDAILVDPKSPHGANDSPSFATNCQGAKYYVDHAGWRFHYSISTTCTCPDGVTPDCAAATGLSKKACNIASFEFCGLVEMDNPSTPCRAV